MKSAGRGPGVVGLSEARQKHQARLRELVKELRKGGGKARSPAWVRTATMDVEYDADTIW